MEETCGAQSIGLFHSAATKWIFSTGTKGMGLFDEDGEDEGSDAEHPFEVKFEPIMANLPRTDETVERFYDHVPRTVEENAHIFDVWARNESKDDPWVKIGKLETRSRFTQSLWGDERLFFQHDDMKNDS